MKPPLILGKLLYYLLLPFIYIALASTRRAYVVVVADGKVLLTKNWLGDHKRWRLPGGGLKPTETYLQAAIRELKEETGLDFNPTKFTKIYLDALFKPERVQYYLLRLERLPSVQINSSELTAAEFINITDLKSEEIDTSVRRILNVIHWS
ncbi:NUDIX hydrolase [Candidatus Saccharibacteria bacterium]|jgi:8-oxo-dGTP diphosphatase|nr:NUDIX hydrolase [Candidatus Saccharibacteria bacterium]HOR23200.1 NUDIX hydrolase [Candidatus Saccharibacteria bacterium]